MMDRKLFEYKFLNRIRHDNSDRPYERKKKDAEYKVIDGDLGHSHPYKSEGRFRYIEKTKTPTRENKTSKSEINTAEKDYMKRIIEKPNRSSTRTNLKCNTANILQTKEENTKKTSGLRSIINLVNQVQSVIATQNNGSNYDLENLYDKPKRKKMIRAKVSDVETAVAGVKVSEVQIADSLIHRFKNNCFPEEVENENDDCEMNTLGMLACRSQMPRLPTEPDTLQKHIFPALQDKHDLMSITLDTKCLQKDASHKKSAASEKNKHRSKYTVLTEAKPNKLQSKASSRESIKHENPSVQKPKSATNETKKKKLAVVIDTVRTGKDDPKVYKAVKFEEKKKLLRLQIEIPRGAVSRTSITNEPEKLPKSPLALVHNTNKIYKSMSRPSKRKKDQVRKSSATSRTKPSVTEVAKWAPASVDAHSKPYYEAWVDTSLTAVSNSSEDNYSKQIVQSYMQLMEERDTPPERYYDEYEDEKYLGRIKIRTKSSAYRD